MNRTLATVPATVPETVPVVHYWHRLGVAPCGAQPTEDASLSLATFVPWVTCPECRRWTLAPPLP